MKSVAVGILAVFMIALVAACSGSGKNENAQIQEPTTDFPDTLRVATLYSPTSYFIYKEEKMGYDYGLVEKLVADKNVVLDLVVATNLASMIAMLDSGLVDLIAYEVPITSEYKDRVLHCGAENFTSQVLVQPKNSEDSRISDVTQLVGRDVYVEKDSKYQHRLENLNNELGGGINIHPIDKDTLITEDLIEMVSDGTIPLTIVDSDIARINKTYYKDLDITLELSFPQRSSWCVSPTKPWLADSINVWFEQESPRRVKATLLKRYFELSKNELSIYNLDLSRGVISVSYDPLFKKYAKQLIMIGVYWRRKVFRKVVLTLMWCHGLEHVELCKLCRVRHVPMALRLTLLLTPKLASLLRQKLFLRLIAVWQNMCPIRRNASNLLLLPIIPVLHIYMMPLSWRASMERILQYGMIT